MNSKPLYPLHIKLLITFCLLISLLAFSKQIRAQEKPPRPITVRVVATKQLYFGKIVPLSDSGGYVTIDANGSPTYNGVLVLNPYACSEALYEVNAEPGVVFNIAYPNPDPILSNGGYHLQMHLGDPYVESRTVPGYQFVTNSQYTYVHIGGTLDVESLLANPAGIYSGTFQVTFIQQ